MMSLQEVQDAYLNKEYENKMEYPYGKYMSQNTVIDEDKSVRWNREQVEKHNKEIDDAKKVYREESTRLQNKLAEDIIAAIQYDYSSINEEQARKIYGYAYQEKHSHFNDVFYFIEELCDLYKDLLELE